MLSIQADAESLVGRSYISLGAMALLHDEQSDGSLVQTDEEVPELAAA